ncbi:MAG: hypothetical protein ACQESG_03760 [Nanobdellota archaeon]
MKWFSKKKMPRYYFIPESWQGYVVIVLFLGLLLWFANLFYIIDAGLKEGFAFIVCVVVLILAYSAIVGKTSG